MLCCLLLSLFTQTFQGRVVGVTDGDTIEVLGANNELRKYRLANIDAPETKGSQPFGQAAKAQLSKKVFGQEVSMQGNTKDKYGRYVGTVTLGNRNINLEMVKEGYAWCYRQYCNDGNFYIAENQARNSRLGLWSQAAIPPWEFRSNSKATTAKTQSKSRSSSPSSSSKKKKK